MLDSPELSSKDLCLVPDPRPRDKACIRCYRMSGQKLWLCLCLRLLVGLTQKQ